MVYVYSQGQSYKRLLPELYLGAAYSHFCVIVFRNLSNIENEFISIQSPGLIRALVSALKMVNVDLFGN